MHPGASSSRPRIRRAVSSSPSVMGADELARRTADLRQLDRAVPDLLGPARTASPALSIYRTIGPGGRISGSSRGNRIPVGCVVREP